MEIERLILAGPRDECRLPPRRAVTKLSVPGTLNSLFGGVSACASSDASLSSVRNCRDCALFEGAHVALRFSCHGTPRTILLPPQAFLPGYGSGAALQWMGRLNQAVRASRSNPMAQDLAKLLDGGPGRAFSRESELLRAAFDHRNEQSTGHPWMIEATRAALAQ